MSDPLMAEARAFCESRKTFSVERFQRVMRVGFVKRMTLLHALEDERLVERIPDGRYAVLCRESTPDGTGRCRKRKGHERNPASNHASLIQTWSVRDVFTSNA